MSAAIAIATPEDVEAAVERVVMERLLPRIMAALRAQQTERWVTRAEAARAWALSVDSIDRRIKEGAITSRRIGKSVRVLLPGVAETRP